MTKTLSPSPREAARLVSALALALSCLVAAQAQTPTAAQPSPAAAPIVTAASTASGVRFAALGPVRQTRLEVFDAAGITVSDTGFLPGNVRDFAARTARGEPLSDGTYLCVLSARDLTGRLSVKQAAVLVAGGRAVLALGEAEPSGAVEVSRGEAAEGAATVTTHDGRDGALTSTAGDLTLRTGDLLAGKDEERVRVTADGKVGVGTDKPEAALDVAGAVRATEGYRFADGTTLNSEGGRLKVTNAAGDPLPASSAAGTGNVNRLAKWAETGGAGTLTDSALFESGGFLGVNTSTPEGTFHMQSPDTTVFKVVSSGTAATGRAVFQMYRGASAQASGWDFGYNLDLGSEDFIIRELTGGAPTIRLNMDKGTGFLGVGTSGTPQARLDVNGTARFTPGGSGGVVNIGSPGGTETGLNITNATTRAEMRFDGTTLKLVAGPNVGPPPATSGVVVNTAGNVGVGTNTPTVGKLHVIGGPGQPAIYGESANRGVWGKSTGSSRGVVGESVSGEGVLGTSTSGAGVAGGSTSSIGVRGETASGNPASPGVQGVSTGGGVGVRGDGATGVYGVSSNGVGVTGEANASGSTGVYGTSTSGYAVYANGNAGQARDKGGFVKAMVYVNPFLPADQYVVRCYNGMTNTSTGNCGFTVTRNLTGIYTIDFGTGFRVNDRFLSLTFGFVPLRGDSIHQGRFGHVRPSGENGITIFVSDVNEEQIDNEFYLVVY